MIGAFERLVLFGKVDQCGTGAEPLRPAFLRVDHLAIVFDLRGSCSLSRLWS